MLRAWSVTAPDCFCLTTTSILPPSSCSMTNRTELIASEPWIWPMITSGLGRGSWVTDTEAVSTCFPPPARNGERLSGSVRVWPGLGVG
jgi:hypothetical protein